MAKSWIKVLFTIAGIYDALLGLTFLLTGTAIFRYASITPPNHIGYVQFPALLLIIFGAMFFRVASAPANHRDLMLYGVALKASYMGVVFWHSLHDTMPALFLVCAWADLLFLVLFLMAWKQTAVAA